MIPLVWASVNVSLSTAFHGTVNHQGCMWILAQISSNSEVSRTFQKCVHDASILCAMVLKIAYTMRPTTLLDIMQFGLCLQHGRHVVAY